MSNEPTIAALHDAIERARARRHDRTIELDARSRVRRVTLPILGGRIFREGEPE